MIGQTISTAAFLRSSGWDHHWAAKDYFRSGPFLTADACDFCSATCNPRRHVIAGACFRHLRLRPGVQHRLHCPCGVHTPLRRELI